MSPPEVTDMRSVHHEIRPLIVDRTLRVVARAQPLRPRQSLGRRRLRVQKDQSPSVRGISHTEFAVHHPHYFSSFFWPGSWRRRAAPSPQKNTAIRSRSWKAGSPRRSSSRKSRRCRWPWSTIRPSFGRTASVRPIRASMKKPRRIPSIASALFPNRSRPSC